MADYDPWRNERDRSRERGERPDRYGTRRYETDYDRDRSLRRSAEDSFGRGSRDDAGEHGAAGDGSGMRGRAAQGPAGYGERDDYRGDFRFGRDREGGRDYGDSAGYGSGGSALDWREVEGDRRSSTERAFGRPSSPDYRSGDFGRRYGYGNDRPGRNTGDDRGFLDRAGDEVRSWFGDEDAERRRRLDSRGESYGQHRGRGPKNYQRSDERIRDDINDRLTDDWHLDASSIDVTVSNQEATLSGTVNSRSDKRRAEDIADSVSGITHVQNNLRVQTQVAGNPFTTDVTGNQSAFSTNRVGQGAATGSTPASTGPNASTGSSASRPSEKV